jgi:hypothetical protein
MSGWIKSNPRLANRQLSLIDFFLPCMFRSPLLLILSAAFAQEQSICNTPPQTKTLLAPPVDVELNIHVRFGAEPFVCLQGARGGYSTTPTIEGCNHNLRIYVWKFVPGDIGPGGFQMYHILGLNSTSDPRGNDFVIVFPNIVIGLIGMDREGRQKLVFIDPCRNFTLDAFGGINDKGTFLKVIDDHAAVPWYLGPSAGPNDQMIHMDEAKPGRVGPKATGYNQILAPPSSNPVQSNEVTKQTSPQNYVKPKLKCVRKH